MDEDDFDKLDDDLTVGLHALALVQTEATADPTWPATLEGLQRALEAIHGDLIWSNMFVHATDLETLRRVRAFVDAWIQTGERPDGIALAQTLYFNLTRGSATMLETSAEFTPTAGPRKRGVTFRIGDVRRDGEKWSARVDISGPGEPFTTRVHGDTWAQAIELAAKQMSVLLEERIEAVGGGTVDPPIHLDFTHRPDEGDDDAST